MFLPIKCRHHSLFVSVAITIVISGGLIFAFDLNVGFSTELGAKLIYDTFLLVVSELNFLLFLKPHYLACFSLLLKIEK
jgi:hypothetical protein